MSDKLIMIQAFNRLVRLPGMISQNNRLLKELLKAQQFNNAITDCNWLKDRSFAPGGWAVDYAFLYTLYRVLRGVNPAQIIEFGLGQSSKLIHQYAAFDNNVQAETVEHDSDWVFFFRKTLNVDYRINISLLPLGEVMYNNKPTTSYLDVQKIFANKQFDLIVVDGPFGSPNYSRIQIMQLLKQNLADSFCILLDDFNRDGEKQTFSEIEKQLKVLGRSYRHRVYNGEKDHALICSENWKFLTTL